MKTPEFLENLRGFGAGNAGGAGGCAWNGGRLSGGGVAKSRKASTGKGGGAYVGAAAV